MIKKILVCFFIVVSVFSVYAIELSVSQFRSKFRIDLSQFKSVKVKVTAYSNDDYSINVPKWRDGRTATNKIAKVGYCAADWKVFPVGTVIYIPEYGFCEVQDRGGAVKGKHIDVFVNTYEEAIEWGVKRKKIYLISKEV